MFFKLTNTVKHIILINILLYVTKYVLYNRGVDLDIYLALSFPASSLFQPWQFLTHMFMHGNLNHLIFNMLVLLFFGSIIERAIGTKRFIMFYFVCGLGASLLHLGVISIEYFNLIGTVSEADLNLVKEQGVDLYFVEGKNWIGILGEINEILLTKSLGASGAMYGIYMASAILFGNREMLFGFLIPIKIKYFVFGLIAMQLYEGLAGLGGNVANFAHLGGALFGFLMLKYWKITENIG